MLRGVRLRDGPPGAYPAVVTPGGLEPATKARSLRKEPGGEVVIIDGPYLETKEHVGGFWILEAANMDEALAWGRKAVVACRVPVEVRAFLRIRPSKKIT